MQQTRTTAKQNEPIFISALQHYLYCPRQYALIHIEQLFAENVHTLRGQAVHQRAHRETFETQPDGTRVYRALPLFHDQLNLIGKADIVEIPPDGTPYPVEYKHGKKRKQLYDDVQLAAQAMCLEYMLNAQVPEGAVYHATSKRRRKVTINEELRQTVQDVIQAIDTMRAKGNLPPPANDSRCKHCSLIGQCQPELIAENAQPNQAQRLFSID